MAALDACNRYRLTSPLRPRRRHRHTRRTTAAPFSSLFSRSIRASLSFALSLPLSFHILLMPSFASRSNFPKISSPPPIRLPPSSHSSQPPRFPIPSPSPSSSSSSSRGRERASLRFEPSFQPSPFPTLTGPADTGSSLLPLPSCSRTPRKPREFVVLGGAPVALLLPPPLNPRFACANSCSPLRDVSHGRGEKRGRKERRRPGDVMERVTRETREENGGKGRRTKGASSSNRKLPKYFTS